MMSKEAMKLALEALEVATTPFARDRQEVLRAQTALREALAEQPAQPNYRRGDRLICLETEEYCVIHISGTDRQWVKFPDTHIGVYKNEQLAELFELLPKEIEFEQPAQQEPIGKVIASVQHLRSISVELLPEVTVPPVDSMIYTSPQPAQRTWVGLTDEEIEKLTVELRDIPVTLAFAIEAKLKEKNT